MHHDKILPSSKSSLTEVKQSEKEKNAKELEWAKKCQVKHIVLNDGQTDVESLGVQCWDKIPKYCKEAFMIQVGISITQKLQNNEVSILTLKN